MPRSRSWPLLLLLAACIDAPPLPDGGWDPNEPAAIVVGEQTLYWLSSDAGVLVFRYGPPEVNYWIALAVFLSVLGVLALVVLFERTLWTGLFFVAWLGLVVGFGPVVGDEEVRVHGQGLTIDVGSWYDTRHQVDHVPVDRIQRVDVRDHVTWSVLPYAEVVVMHDGGEQVLVRLPQARSDEVARENLAHAEHIGALVRERLDLSDGE